MKNTKRDNACVYFVLSINCVNNHYLLILWLYEFVHWSLKYQNSRGDAVIPEAGVFLWLSPPAVGILAVKCTCLSTVVAHLQLQ